MTKLLTLLLLAAFLLQACGNSEEPKAHDAFFDALASHCGDAFAGGLTLEPPGDDMLEGDELLVVHFRECDDNQLKIPFHIQNNDGSWDRSRTWIITRHQDGLELRHDHRNEDGSEDEVTMYGGFQVNEGEHNWQMFASETRTQESGYFRGWRIEIEPEERYTYGTMRRDDWSWRIDFNLNDPIDTPPAPWGHE